MSDRQWGIISDYGFQPIEIVKETEKTFTYIDRTWGRSSECRRHLAVLLKWRGDEASARKIVERLTSAKAEKDRRVRAASDWFTKERAKILALPTAAPAGSSSSPAFLHSLGTGAAEATGGGE